MPKKKGQGAPNVAALKIQLWNTIAVQLGGVVRLALLAVIAYLGLLGIREVHELVGDILKYASLLVVTGSYGLGVWITRRKMTEQRDDLQRLRGERKALEAQIIQLNERVERLSRRPD